MNNFKRLSSWILMLALVLCFTVAFASCGYVDEPADNTPAACTHADGNKDHKCDTCGEKFTECSNNNKDHKCDICGASLGDCADDDKDHYCDVCNAECSKCGADSSPIDHKCDICGDVLSGCADDYGNDHKCDHCGAVLTQCADTYPDHKCDVCQKTMSSCEDVETDDDHKCDWCKKSMCFDDNGDGNCEKCGAPLCYDNNNDCRCDDCNQDMHIDNNNDHTCDKCNTKYTDCSDVDTDSDHNCDVCQKNLCTDVDGNRECDGCGAALARITAYIPSPMCSAWAGPTVKKVEMTEEGGTISFTPVYHGGTYVIDFWAVYDSTGAVFTYVENGSRFETNVEGTYTVLPVFIANNTTGVSDNNLTLEMSTGTGSNAPDDSCITPVWADSELSNKLQVVGSIITQVKEKDEEGKEFVIETNNNGYMLSDATDVQMYVTVDPTNAANTVLLWAVNSNTSTGMGKSIVKAAVDPASKGSNMVISFDYQLEYLYSAAGIENLIYLTDTDGKVFCLARMLTETGTKKFSGNVNGSTPVESAWILKTLLKTATNDETVKNHHGSGTVNLSSDTWYTITIEIDAAADTVTVYYAPRGGERQRLATEEFSPDFDASKITSLTFMQGIYNNRQISLLDNIVVKRVHECDAGNDHVCDICSVKLCADGSDDDHKCDTCGDALCFEGDIPDHRCEICSATFECYDSSNDGNHSCDVCLSSNVTQCSDSDDEDHKCDDCGVLLCRDSNKDGACDGCSAHVCVDNDSNYRCDVCKVYSFNTNMTSGQNGVTILHAQSSVNGKSDNESTKANADNSQALTTITTDAKSKTYTFGAYYSIVTDPQNSANSMLCVNVKAGEGSGNWMQNFIKFTPEAVDANGGLIVMEADVYVGSSSSNGKNAIHLTAFSDAYDGAHGTSRSTGYQDISFYKYADGTLSISGVATTAEVNQWVNVKVIFDTVNNTYSVYWSVDGKTFTAVKNNAEPSNTKRLANFADIKYLGIAADTYQTSSKSYVDNLKVSRLNTLSINTAAGNVMLHTVCSDVDTDKDHKCDFDGCEKIVTACVDSDENHICESCGEKSRCIDADGNGYCDFASCSAICFESGKLHAEGPYTSTIYVTKGNAYTAGTTDYDEAVKANAYGTANLLASAGHVISVVDDPSGAANSVLRVVSRMGGTSSYIDVNLVRKSDTADVLEFTFDYYLDYIIYKSGNFDMLYVHLWDGTTRPSANADIRHFTLRSELTANNATAGALDTTDYAFNANTMTTTKLEGGLSFTANNPNTEAVVNTHTWYKIKLIVADGVMYRFYSADNGDTWNFISKSTSGTTTFKDTYDTASIMINSYNHTSRSYFDNVSFVALDNATINLADYQ